MPRRFPARSLVARTVWLVALLLSAVQLSVAAAAENSASEKRESRMFDAVRRLASDEWEGRGVGTAGIDKAAQFVADRFTEIGLDTKRYDGTPFQKFRMSTDPQLGARNTLALSGPGVDKGAPALKLNDDFTPLAIGGSARLDAPLVFVGYGITAKNLNYDDYAGVNVEGKIVLVLRHEPEQNNPHSVFDGTNQSPLATFSRKLSNAYEHGAVAAIFVTDEYDRQQKLAQRQKMLNEAIDDLAKEQAEFQKNESPSQEQLEAFRAKAVALARRVAEQGDKLKQEYDPVVNFQGAGPGDAGSRIPALHVRRGVVEKLVEETLHKSLAELEKAIDDHGPKPQSAEMPGASVRAEITVNRKEVDVKNVVGVLEGEGPTAEETLVVGAHYDHLGWGGQGSFVPDQHVIHNGADDNASGTAALMEVARLLKARDKKLHRRVVFIAFTGEELGLHGSAFYTKHPLAPMASTIAMLNMDMVGRLSNNKLIIQGVDTADAFGPLVDSLNSKYMFDITRQSGGFGPSDHSSFYAQKMPVMHIFTGLHDDYHRPTDDYDKINAPGMRRVAEMVAEMAVQIADAPDRPKYKEVQSTSQLERGGDRPYFGSIPDFSQTGPGYGISGVAKDSPAQRAGLQGGDSVLKLGDSRIGNLDDFDSALRKYKGGDKVPVVVRRGSKELTVEVVLEPPK